MPNYLVWRDHGEVEPPVVGTESDRNEDDDQMDEMLADIGWEYEVGSGEQGQPPEVQNFYRLKQLFLSEEIVKQMRWHHEGKRESEDPDIMSHPADSEA
jgi:hypothetical protein